MAHEKALKSYLELKPMLGVPLEDIYWNKVEEHLKIIQRETNPRRFKESMLHIMQLYYDGLLDNNYPVHDKKIWTEQKETLDVLMKCMRNTVWGFFGKGAKIDYSSIRDSILGNASNILKYSSEEYSRSRNLTGIEQIVLRSVEHINKKLPKDEKYLIVPIASAGFEPAFLAAELMDVDDIFTIRYSHIAKDDKEVILPKQAPSDAVKQSTTGKKILIIEDIISTGETLQHISQWIKKNSLSDVYLATACSSYWPKWADFKKMSHSNHLYIYQNH